MFETIELKHQLLMTNDFRLTFYCFFLITLRFKTRGRIYSDWKSFNDTYLIIYLFEVYKLNLNGYFKNERNISCFVLENILLKMISARSIM
jgi:hypothetical protein